MEANPYTQTANDPTTQMGLMQVLQQIQALQNQPLIPDNPLSQPGAALQGASAGFQGQPNPAIAQAAALRQQQLTGMSQTAGVLGQIGMLQQQQRDMSFKERDYKLRVDMETRRLKSEEDKNKRDEAHQRLNALAPLAKEWGSSANRETRLAGIAAQQALLKSVGVEMPEALWEGLKADPPFDPKQLNLLAHAIEGKQPDEILTRMFPGVTPAQIAITREALKTDSGRKAFGLQTTAEQIKDEQGAREATAKAESAMFAAQAEGRIAHLTRLPARTQDQELELLTLRDMKGAPDLVRSVTLTLMRRGNLALDQAAAQAKKLLAEVKEDRDFTKVVKALMDTGLSEPEAILAANQKMQASKKGFEEQELALDAARGMLSRVIRYSGGAITRGPVGSFLFAPWTAIKSWSGQDPDLEGLKRLSAELPGVLRLLGQKGVISDRDIMIGERLIPSPYKSTAIAGDSVRTIAEILERAEKNLARMKASARSIGPAVAPRPSTEANDPNDLRRYKLPAPGH